MTDKRTQQEAENSNMAKDPDERQATAGRLVIDMLDALGQPAPSCLAA